MSDELVVVICGQSGCSRRLAGVYPKPGGVRIAEFKQKVRLAGFGGFRPERIPAETESTLAELASVTFHARCPTHRLRQVEGADLDTALRPVIAFHASGGTSGTKPPATVISRAVLPADAR